MGNFNLIIQILWVVWMRLIIFLYVCLISIAWLIENHQSIELMGWDYDLRSEDPPVTLCNIFTFTSWTILQVARINILVTQTYPSFANSIFFFLGFRDLIFPPNFGSRPQKRPWGPSSYTCHMTDSAGRMDPQKSIVQLTQTKLGHWVVQFNHHNQPDRLEVPSGGSIVARVENGGFRTTNHWELN